MASASFSFVLAREPGDEFLFPRRYSEAILLLRESSRKHKKNYRERPRNRIHIICSENALGNYFSFYEKVLDN